MAVNQDGRYDLSWLPHLRGQPGLERHGPGGRQPVGRPPGRLRPDRGHRHADLQRPRHRRCRHQRPALPVGPGPDRRSRTASTCPTARPARSWPAGRIVTNGYHDRPELNAERFRGGWWHTGDLGRRHPDGSITFVAPLTRIVKSAAENIYPAEVEGCLLQPPGGEGGGHHRRARPKMDPAGVGRRRPLEGPEGETVTAEELIDALPVAHRLLQEAEPRRVRRRAAPPGLGHRLRRAGRALRGRGLPGPGFDDLNRRRRSQRVRQKRAASTTDLMAAICSQKCAAEWWSKRRLKPVAPMAT